jgi:hypothetical protein
MDARQPRSWLGPATLVAAMTWAAAASAFGVGLSGDVTVGSRYMAHGWNIGGNEPFVFPSVTVDAAAPGLQFALWTAWIMDRDQFETDEFDYMVKYGRTCCPDSRWAANFHGYVDYWVYPHSDVVADKDGQTIPETTKDGVKFHAGVSLPNLLRLGPACLVPSYNVYYWTPVKSDLFEDGAAHEVFLSYAMPLAEIAASLKDRGSVALSASATYHDGAFGVAHGWSHATAHLALPLTFGKCYVTPAANHQWSFEDSVNPTDEFWATLSVGGGW